jgi:riboflavin biosynthesis RibT protein
MLVKYKISHEKIAMGLLSFMPGAQDIKSLQEMIKTYETDPAWQLYLCKQGDDFVALIGIEIQDYTFTVHHLSVNPSFRDEGIGHMLVEKVQELQEPRAMQAAPETKDFLSKCWETLQQTH